MDDILNDFLLPRLCSVVFIFIFIFKPEKNKTFSMMIMAGSGDGGGNCLIGIKQFLLLILLANISHEQEKKLRNSIQNQNQTTFQ